MVVNPMMPKAVCLIHVKDGKVLAVSRPGHPDQFGLPGGKVEPGEGLHQAIHREMEEETGLLAHWPDPIYTCVCKGDVDYYTTAFWCDSVIGDIVPEAGLIVKYVDPDVLLAGPFGSYNKYVMQMVGVIPFDSGGRAVGFAYVPDDFEWEGWR